jgi:hypothetical protein
VADALSRIGNVATREPTPWNLGRFPLTRPDRSERSYNCLMEQKTFGRRTYLTGKFLKIRMMSIFARYLRNIDQFFPLIQRQKFGCDQSDLKMESALKVYIRQQQEACSKISQLKLHVTIRFTKNKNHEHGIKSI